jgi:hypothetical protein
MEPHADPALDAARPLMGSKRSLTLDGRLDGAPRAAERVEERVALRVHLAAAVRDEGPAQQAAVVGQELAVALAKLLEQGRRTLDVSEEHRHCPGRHRMLGAHHRIRHPDHPDCHHGGNPWASLAATGSRIDGIRGGWLQRIEPRLADDRGDGGRGEGPSGVFAGRSIRNVADQVDEIISQLDKEPVVTGHSYRGLLAQIVAGRGLAAVA